MAHFRLPTLLISSLSLTTVHAATYETRATINYTIVVDGANTIQLNQETPTPPAVPTPTTQLHASTLVPFLDDVPVPGTGGEFGALQFYYVASADAFESKMGTTSILELEEPSLSTWESITANSFARGIFRDVYDPDLIYSTIPEVSGSILRGQLWIKVSGGNFVRTWGEDDAGVHDLHPGQFPPGAELEAITSIGASFDGTPPAPYLAHQWSSTNGRQNTQIPAHYIELDVPWTSLATSQEFAITLQTAATMTMDNPANNLDFQPFKATAAATWDAALEIIGMEVFDGFGNRIRGAEALVSQTGYDYTLTEAIPDPAIDTNNDNIGDVYANHFGVAGSNPGDDADGDGFSIFEEEIFYTDPNDAASYPHIRIASLGADSISLDWDTVRGVGYRLESSPDGKTWTNVTRLLVGDGSVFTEIVPRDASRRLFRLRGEVVDSDGDQLSDADEAITGTDPSNPDQDGDGLDDGFEVTVPGLDPATSNDPTQDADNNGQADVLDYAGFLGTNAALWIGPAAGDWNMGVNWSGGSVPAPGQVAVIDPTGAGNVTVTVLSDAGCKALLGKGSLVIDGATFSAAGKIFCNNLSLVNGATLTSSLESKSHYLVKACGDLLVDATSEIDLTGLGYPGTEGPGAPIYGGSPAGGSHGGRGGRGSGNSRDELGATYGSILTPVTLGSGASRFDGQGGGALRLGVEGNLQLDGILRADGGKDRSSVGSGGSIWIDCAAFSGGGTVSAVGANGSTTSGSGGGGRIAVYYDGSTFSGSIVANGGNSGWRAGAGSIYTRERSAPRGTIIFDNAGISPNPDTTVTPVVPGSLIGDFDLFVSGGALLASPPQQVLRIVTSGYITIDANSAIELSGEGFPTGQGPGTAQVSGQTTAGGSHGGRGGISRFGSLADLGLSYGSIEQPADFGSGASRGAGSGGGALRIDIGGILEVAGAIRANGRAESGSGGSIWIDCGTLTGSGDISAAGATGGSFSGSGGGGRIAVYYDSSTFAGSLAANGGGIGSRAGAGSVYTRLRSAPKATILIDNAGITPNLDTTITPALPGSLVGDFDLIVSGGALLTSPTEEVLRIVTSGNITIDANSAIDVTGDGFPSGQGPGTAQVSGQTAAGGSHGGRGGIARFGSVADLGTSYGSIEQPADFGSGASRGGGSGGGALRIDSGGTLEVLGAIRADGRKAGDSAGSGGSVWIDCGTLTGSGAISAAGAEGSSLSGSGGGGRIAVYYDSSTFAGSMAANGGGIGSRGGAGSIYIQEAGAGLPTLRYDNQLAALPTRFNDGLTPVGPTLNVIANIEVGGGARLTGETGQTLTITTPGNLTIAAVGQVDMTGQGHGRFSGPGAACDPQPGGAGVGVPSGASHAGGGGEGWHLLPYCSADRAPPSYGDFREPVTMGSGSHSAGGGAIRIIVDRLTVDGLISADGQVGVATGSGGSIWITCNPFAGTGTISAKGGYIEDPTPLGGAGGGGRIAVYSSNSTFTGSQEVWSNNPGSPGSPGTVYLDLGGIQSLIIDGGGNISGSFTVIDSLIELTGDFVLINGAKVSRDQAPSDHTIEVIAGGDITIGAGSAINLSGRATGLGLIGASSIDPCSGSGKRGGMAHGGDGGYVELTDSCEICPPLGIEKKTITMGSFAHGSPYSPRTTGHGQAAGGAIVLQAGGTLTVDGDLLAHAEASVLNAASGGSVFLSAQTIAGSGTVDVSGGDTAAPNTAGTTWGGGGGGRIAIYAHNAIPTTLTLSAAFGVSLANQPGPAGMLGTIFQAQFPLNAVTGDIVEIAPPGDLRQDAREGNRILMFPANEVKLDNLDEPTGNSCNPNPYFGPVDLDAFATGLYDESSDLATAPVTTLSDGTSYILHADLPAGPSGSLTGTVTFDRDIVGVRALDLDPLAVGEILGAPFEKTFANANGLELDAGDSFEISPDRRTLTVTLSPGTGIDRLIVVTQHRDFNQWTP